MAKPRIIIADTDLSFIHPFLLKFAEDFFYKVDLEIITSERYYDELFSKSQRADILIVSEGLYSADIQRHNISHVFVMTEQPEEEQTTDLNANHIFKYDRGIKEIFNEILGKSGLLGQIDPDNKTTQVVVFFSAAGGVGKTTVSMGVAASLAKNYKRVLYINASRLQCFQHMLENPAPITDMSVYTKLLGGSEGLYASIKHVIREEKFFYLPPFQGALLSLGLDYSVYSSIIRASKESGEYDFIIVDADVVFDEEKGTLLDMAARVMILTNQSLASVSATRRLVESMNDIANDKFIFLCNDFEKEKDSAIIQVMRQYTMEFVEHFRYGERMKPENLAGESSIQMVAFLLI